MNLHEYQSKQLFAKYGIAVPTGYAAANPQEAVAAARRIGGMFIPMSIQKRLEAIKNANLVPQRLTPEEREEAARIFRDDILRTQDLIGRDLSRWLAPAS